MSTESSGWYERQIARARGDTNEVTAFEKQASADEWYKRDVHSPKAGAESRWGTAAGAAKELQLLKAFSSNADQCASGPNLWKWASATYASTVGGRDTTTRIAKADLKPQEKSVRTPGI